MSVPNTPLCKVFSDSPGDIQLYTEVYNLFCSRACNEVYKACHAMPTFDKTYGTRYIHPDDLAILRGFFHTKATCSLSPGSLELKARSTTYTCQACGRYDHGIDTCRIAQRMPTIEIAFRTWFDQSITDVERASLLMELQCTGGSTWGKAINYYWLKHTGELLTVRYLGELAA